LTPFLTFLLVDDWFIYAWDDTRRQVLVYNTELWPDWYRARHGEDNPAVMAPYIDQHTPDILAPEQAAKFWNELERSFPGITAATRHELA